MILLSFLKSFVRHLGNVLVYPSSKWSRDDLRGGYQKKKCRLSTKEVYPSTLAKALREYPNLPSIGSSMKTVNRIANSIAQHSTRVAVVSTTIH